MFCVLFSVFLNPVFLHKLDALKNVVELNMILMLWSNFTFLLLKCQHILNE